LPLAVASVELSSILPAQKIIITDGFRLDQKFLNTLTQLDWNVLENRLPKGASAAKNNGIREIRNDIDYVTFLDADDISHRNHFKECIQKLKSDNLAAVGCQAVTFRVNSSFPKKTLVLGHPLRPLNPHDIREHQNQKRVTSVYASVVFRRDLLNQIGFFDESKLRGEDFDFYGRFIQKGYDLGNISSQLYAYNHPMYDTYPKFKFDNQIRGRARFLVFRYLRNCLLRTVSFPIKKQVRLEWQSHFEAIKHFINQVNLYPDYGLNRNL
jgi:GT2 family glycosyltransferase